MYTSLPIHYPANRNLGRAQTVEPPSVSAREACCQATDTSAHGCKLKVVLSSVFSVSLKFLLLKTLKGWSVFVNNYSARK